MLITGWDSHVAFRICSHFILPWNPWIVLKSGGYSFNNPDSIFSYRWDVTSDQSYRFRCRFVPESSGNFHLNLHHPDIPFLYLLLQNWPGLPLQFWPALSARSSLKYKCHIRQIENHSMNLYNKSKKEIKKLAHYFRIETKNDVAELFNTQLWTGERVGEYSGWVDHTFQSN